MEYYYLGQTGLKVSKVCFGTLALGPLQGDICIDDSVALIDKALNLGINFYDTAELYKTYDRLGAAIKAFGRNSFVISTKSYAYDTETAKYSLDKALTEMNTDYIDIFSLHEQESKDTLRGHMKALEYLQKMKSEGVIKAIGISTHHIAAVEAATASNMIDVIHPIINVSGLGIQDGTLIEMEQAIDQAYEAGKGIYAMKALGGGNLINQADVCFDYIIKCFNRIHSVAIGMRTAEELEMNVLKLNHQEVPDVLQKKINTIQRKLLINDWCEMCGCCVDHCSYDALKMSHDKIDINTEKCVLCGYCGSWCPQLCIKII